MKNYYIAHVRCRGYQRKLFSFFLVLSTVFHPAPINNVYCFLFTPRDAEDAVKARDGYDYDGYRLRVEFPRGGGPGSYRGSRGNERSRGEGRSRGPATKRSQYRVLVSGLPPSGSWQDLKDHMREAGDVCFADTYKDGTGVVEFLRHEDMKYAIKKLDDSRFRSHEVNLRKMTNNGI